MALFCAIFSRKGEGKMKEKEENRIEEIREQMIADANRDIEVAKFMRLLESYCWMFFYETESFQKDPALVKCYRRLLEHSGLSPEMKEKYAI